MKKWLRLRLAVILIISINSAAFSQHARLLQHRSFPAYSSASAAEWHKRRLYILGDDAPGILILNKRLRITDSLPLFEQGAKRIAATKKADIEAAFCWKEKGKKYLVFLSSFSTPIRNKLVVLQPQQNIIAIEETSLGSKPPRQPNIEGAARFGQKVLLANRALAEDVNNELLLYDFNVAKGLGADAKYITLKTPQTQARIGVSGLTYLPKQDILLLTFSSETTTSATTDGVIGASYLGIAYNAGTQIEKAELIIDSLIDLAPVLKTQQPQKIESVTVASVKRSKTILYLVADNDNGSSEVFQISVTLRR